MALFSPFAALELLAEQPDLEIVMAPVSGGGLLSGTAIAARGCSASIEVLGAEPEQADDAVRSFRAGRLEPASTGNTIADGLRATLCARTLAIICREVSDILTVSEAQIIDATEQLWQTLKVVEPSGAVPFAAVIAHPAQFAGKRVGIVLSGGNFDYHF